MEFDARTITPRFIRIRNDLRPGDIGAVTRLHGLVYSSEYGWDYTFEAYVAGPLAEFARAHTEGDRIWIVEHDGEIGGSIGIVDAGSGDAQLRWFVLEPRLRGLSLGKKLLDEAIAFAVSAGYSRLSLWTVSVLVAAARLYVAAGFELTVEHTTVRWGQEVTEQRYELVLG